MVKLTLLTLHVFNLHDDHLDGHSQHSVKGSWHGTLAQVQRSKVYGFIRVQYSEVGQAALTGAINNDLDICIRLR